MLTRIITALVLLAVIVAAVVAGPAAVCALLALVLALACWEWARIAGIPGKVGAVVGAIIAVGFYAERSMGLLPGGVAFQALTGAATLCWLVFCVILARRRVTGWMVGRPIMILSAVVFLPAFWWSAIDLYGEGNWILLVSVMMLVWIADSMAYFTGVAFGRYTGRMAPGISPKKSWAGFAGAHVFVLLIAYGVWAIWPHFDCFTTRLINGFGVAGAFPILIAFVLLSIAGDLFESALKRTAGVKDSSSLLPGHGGILDRIDALLPVIPAAALMLTLA